MRRLAITAAISLLLAAGAAIPLAEAADDVTKCGVAQLKALLKLNKVVNREGIKACVNGSAMNPGPVDAVKVTAATGKFAEALAKAEAKFGDVNCFDFSIDRTVPAENIDDAEAFANDLCLVP